MGSSRWWSARSRSRATEPIGKRRCGGGRSRRGRCSAATHGRSGCWTRSSTGPTALHYVDAVLGNLRSAGFSIENAAHAFWLLDSYVYGHVVQETSLPFNTSDEMTEPPRSTSSRSPRSEYPHLVEIEEHALRSEYSFDNEFEFGLDLILDGLEDLHEESAGGTEKQ